MAYSQPGKHWRNSLMGSALKFKRISADNPDESFLRLVEHEYEQATLALSRHIAEGINPEKIEGYRYGIYFSAIALLTYGRIDVIPDILKNLPPRDTNMYVLHGSIAAIIPLPPRLSNDLDTKQDEVIAWVQSHKDKLMWDDDATCFVFISTPVE